MSKALKDIQKELDEKKYYESELARTDMSGKMEYCDVCPYRQGLAYEAICRMNHEARVSNNLCASSYNRMIKEKKKNGND